MSTRMKAVGVLASEADVRILGTRAFQFGQEHEVGVALGWRKTAEFSVELKDWKLSGFIESKSDKSFRSQRRHSDHGRAGAGLKRSFSDAPISDVEVKREPVTAASKPTLPNPRRSGESTAIARLLDMLPKKLGVHSFT